LRFHHLLYCFALIGTSLGIESGAYTFPFHILCAIQYVQYQLDPFLVCLISFSLAFISAVTTIRWACKMISFLRWVFYVSILSSSCLSSSIRECKNESRSSGSRGPGTLSISIILFLLTQLLGGILKLVITRGNDLYSFNFLLKIATPSSASPRARSVSSLKSPFFFFRSFMSELCQIS